MSRLSNRDTIAVTVEVVTRHGPPSLDYGTSDEAEDRVRNITRDEYNEMTSGQITRLELLVRNVIASEANSKGQTEHIVRGRPSRVNVAARSGNGASLHTAVTRRGGHAEKGLDTDVTTLGLLLDEPRRDDVEESRLVEAHACAKVVGAVETKLHLAFEQLEEKANIESCGVLYVVVHFNEFLGGAGADSREAVRV